MALVTVESQEDFGDVTLLKLARELAMEIHSVEEILKRHKIDEDQWAEIQKNQTFLRYLESAAQAWQSATNTHERVKLKAAAAVEEWMPQLFADIHKDKESLSAKIEGGKLLARLAGMGLDRANIGEGSGETFKVTINLGASDQIQITKDVTPKVIDGEATETK